MATMVICVILPNYLLKARPTEDSLGCCRLQKPGSSRLTVTDRPTTDVADQVQIKYSREIGSQGKYSEATEGRMRPQWHPYRQFSATHFIERDGRFEIEVKESIQRGV